MSPEARWHVQRHVRILQEHPEIRALFGPWRGSQLWIAGLVLLDLGLAVVAQHLPWWGLLLLSWCVGAVVSHTTGLFIHEGTHNLIAHGTRANKVWMLVANIPIVAPLAMEFRAQHLLHHKFLGDVDGFDTQAPTRSEIAAVGSSAWKKLASFTLGRFYWKGRPQSDVRKDGWAYANIAVQIVTMSALVWFVGFKALAFLMLNALFGFGPHPLGARRITEHFAVRRDQPTVSYYGPWNPISLNVGYHTEHHDFPAVAWWHLPELHRIAKPAYDELFSVRSWTKLMIRYVIDPKYRVEHYTGFGVYLDPYAESTVSTKSVNTL